MKRLLIAVFMAAAVTSLVIAPVAEPSKKKIKAGIFPRFEVSAQNPPPGSGTISISGRLALGQCGAEISNGRTGKHHRVRCPRRAIKICLADRRIVYSSDNAHVGITRTAADGSFSGTLEHEPVAEPYTVHVLTVGTLLTRATKRLRVKCYPPQNGGVDVTLTPAS